MPTQTITSLSQLDLDAVYSYADYLLWRLDERVELIRGKLAKMSPAPNRRHQEIITNLFGLFLNKMAIGAHCKIYTAPFDVRLVKNPLGKLDNEVYTVIQPDLHHLRQGKAGRAGLPRRTRSDHRDPGQRQLQARPQDQIRALPRKRGERILDHFPP